MAGRTLKITILGDAKGGQGAFDQLSGSADGFAAKIGSVFGGLGKIALVGVGAVAGAAVGLGAAAYKIGESFDSAYDTIRTDTGATGEALDGLKDDFKAVVSDVPTDFGSASQAVADLNTRLGLTGKPLQDLSKQFLNLNRVTGEDLPSSIAAGTRLFGDWSISTENQGKALDYLYKVSQATGIGVTDLMQKVVQFGAPLRQMGFSFEESAALMGKWEREGVNTELVLGSLRIALGKFSNEGVKDTHAALLQTIRDIQNAGSVGEATAKAIDVFGARAGPDMAAAIREGRLGVDELMASLAASQETINSAADDTADFAERWQLFKNKAMVALEPVASAAFGLAGTLMDRLGPALLLVIGWLSDRLPGAVARVVGLLDRLQGAVAGPLVAAFHYGWTFARDAVLTFVQALQGNWTSGEGIRPLHNILGQLGLIIREQVIPAIQSAAAFVTGVFAYGWTFARDAVLTFVQALQGNWTSGEGIRPLHNILGQLGLIIREQVIPAVQSAAAFVTGTLVPAFLAIAAQVWPVLQSVLSQIATHFSTIATVVGVAIAVFTTLSTIAPIITGIIGVISLLASGTAGLIAIITAIAPAAAGATTVMGALAAALGGPVVIAIAAVALAAAGLYLAWQTNFLGIRDIVAQVWAAVQPVLQAIQDHISAFVTSILPDLQGAWQNTQTAISAVVSVIQAIVTAVFTAIAGFLSAHGAEILGILQGAWTEIQGIVQIATSIIEGVIRVALAIIAGDWSGAWQAIKDTLSGVWDGIQQIVDGALQIVQNLVRIGVDAVKELWSAGWSALSGAVRSAEGEISGAVDSVIATVKGAFAGAGGWLLDAGRAIIRGLIDGITSALPDLGGALSGVSSFITSHKGPIDVDLRLLQPAGQAIMQGLQVGIESQLGNLQTTLAGITEQISGSVGPGSASSPASGARPATAGRSAGAGDTPTIIELTNHVHVGNETVYSGFDRYRRGRNRRMLIMGER